MRLTSTFSIFTLVFFSLLFSDVALGKEIPSIFAGYGLGFYTWDGADDVRGSEGWFADEFAGQLYLELFPIERLGFGLRYVEISGFDSDDSTGFSEGVIISNKLVTVLVFPIISDGGIFRIGLRGGAGQATYKYEDGAGNSYTTKGSVREAGFFFDVGGTGAGVRAGWNTFRTNLDPLIISPTDERNVHGSGGHLYFEFRWAF